jgi:hypothetical protein
VFLKVQDGGKFILISVMGPPEVIAGIEAFALQKSGPYVGECHWDTPQSPNPMTHLRRLPAPAGSTNGWFWHNRNTENTFDRWSYIDAILGQGYTIAKELTSTCKMSYAHGMASYGDDVIVLETTTLWRFCQAA